VRLHAVTFSPTLERAFVLYFRYDAAAELTGVSINGVDVFKSARVWPLARDDFPDDLGRNPRFKFTPKEKVPVVIRKPAWLVEHRTSNAELKVTDPLTGQIFPHTEDADTIRVELPRLDLGQILWIPTPQK